MVQEDKTLKIATFQGTFNPIHNAHLAMAEYVRTHYDYDKIIFIPAYQPPHKECECNLSAHRLNMVQLAVENAENVEYKPSPEFLSSFLAKKFNPLPKVEGIVHRNSYEVSDIEYKRNEPSFTYKTIQELYKIYDIEGKIGFIIGEDAFVQIESWNNADEMKNMVEFIVLPRSENFNKEIFAQLGAKGYNYRVAGLKFNDISSTEIRNLVKTSGAGSIKNLVPEKVRDYIEKNELYKQKC